MSLRLLILVRDTIKTALNDLSHAEKIGKKNNSRQDEAERKVRSSCVSGLRAPKKLDLQSAQRQFYFWHSDGKPGAFSYPFPSLFGNQLGQ